MTDAEPTASALPRRTGKDARREDIRFRLLRTLGGDPAVSQRRLARETGVSLGAANGLVNAMIEAGLVRVENAGTAPGSFRIAYVLTADGQAEKARLAKPFLARRRAELAALHREIDATEADPGQETDPRA